MSSHRVDVNRVGRWAVPTNSSAAFPGWLALLEEGAEPLEPILAQEDLALQRSLALERLDKRALLSGAHGPTDALQRQRCLGGQPSGVGRDFLGEPLGREHMVRQPDRARLVGGDCRAAIDQLQRAPQPDDPRQRPGAAAVGNETDPDKQLGELRSLRDQPDVARQRDVASQPGRDPVDRPDNWPARVVDRQQRRVIDLA
jgi:hypothetical protein